MFSVLSMKNALIAIGILSISKCILEAQNTLNEYLNKELWNWRNFFNMNIVKSNVFEYCEHLFSIKRKQPTKLKIIQFKCLPIVGLCIIHINTIQWFFLNPVPGRVKIYILYIIHNIFCRIFVYRQRVCHEY